MEDLLSMCVVHYIFVDDPTIQQPGLDFKHSALNQFLTGQEPCHANLGPDCLKILTQSYDNLRNFVHQPMPILRQICCFFLKKRCDNFVNSFNIINMTKYIEVNNKASFIYVIARN